MTRYDGVVYSKCVQTDNFQISGAANYAALCVSWGANGISSQFNKYLSDDGEFTTMQGIYEQYKVVGLKIKLETISQVTNSTGSGLYALQRASDPNTQLPITTSIADMAKKMDYKAYSNTRGMIKMYYNIGKYFGKTRNNNGWLNTGTYYNAASTLIKMEHAGFPADAVLGKYQVTWYVKFKGFTG